MIQKNEVIAFFDKLAPTWDSDMKISPEKIRLILENAGVYENTHVLDVACGTGVLIPFYLERKVSSITAVDISPEMIRIAKEKYQQKNVHFLCGDIEECNVGSAFDSVVVYNAFPHFPDSARLIARLSGLLKVGGTLTVAHGMSREKIDAHHHGSAGKVSNGLMEAEKLAEVFAKTLQPTVVLSNEMMYQVAGKRIV